MKVKPESRGQGGGMWKPANLQVLSRAFAGMVVVLLAVTFLSGADRNKNAQPYALIFGTVWSPDSRPVAGVRVRIRRADEKKARWERISDLRGEFAQRVPAGTADYVISAEIKGRKGPPIEAKVHIINDERQDVGLHLTE